MSSVYLMLVCAVIAIINAFHDIDEFYKDTKEIGLAGPGGIKMLNDYIDEYFSDEMEYCLFHDDNTNDCLNKKDFRLLMLRNYVGKYDLIDYKIDIIESNDDDGFIQINYTASYITTFPHCRIDQTRIDSIYYTSEPELIKLYWVSDLNETDCVDTPYQPQTTEQYKPETTENKPYETENTYKPETESPTKSIIWETHKPTGRPTKSPTTTTQTTKEPTKKPTSWPTSSPTDKPTCKPTAWPTIYPTVKPSIYPTYKPTQWPTAKPTNSPTYKPTDFPTAWPTKYPTRKPSQSPTNNPTKYPTRKSTKSPTAKPTAWPTKYPTAKPTAKWPSKSPSYWPTNKPIMTNPWPSKKPETDKPTLSPTVSPTKQEQVYGEKLDEFEFCDEYRGCKMNYKCVQDPRYTDLPLLNHPGICIPENSQISDYQS